MLVLRVHLDETGAENAPLLIAPGSHRLGRVPEPEVAAAVARLGTASCEAGSGDVWAYRALILHASDRARAPTRRRILQLAYSCEALPGGLEWVGLSVSLGSVIRSEHSAALRPRLLPGERLLWAGQPRRGLRLRAADLYLIPFSLLWCGFVIVWLHGGRAAGAERLFLAPGIIMLAAGVYAVAGRFLWDAWLRSRLVYGVTDRRVLMLRTGAFPRLRALDLRYLPTLELEERRGGNGSIAFDVAPPGDFLSVEAHLDLAPAASRIPRFIEIADVRSVYQLISRECERIRNEERARIPPERAFIG